MILRLCAAVLVLLPTTAFAQGDPGPFGAFFGRTPERTGREFTVVDLRTSTGGQYDNPVFDPPEVRLASGSLLATSARLRFARRSDRLQLEVGSSGAFHYFLREPGVGGTTIDNRASFSGKLTTRLSIDASVAHAYQPFFNYEQLPIAFNPGVVPPTARYVARAVETHSFDGNAGFTSFYAKDASLYASVTRRETRFIQTPDLDFRSTGVRGGWRRHLSRDLTLRLEYGRERIHLSGGEYRDRLHETIDVGFDFTRPLSRSRRTMLNVRTQTSIMQRPPVGRYYRLNGGAGVTRLFGRTWEVTAHADRTTDFLAGFVEPLLGHTAGVRLNGLLSRRTELLVQADGGRGEFGFDSNFGPFAMANAVTQVNYALSRRFGVFVQHALMYYEVPRGASPVTPLTQMGRQTTTFGITTWIPLYVRERSPSDTR